MLETTSSCGGNMGAEPTVKEMLDQGMSLISEAISRHERTLSDVDARLAIGSLLKVARVGMLERVPTLTERREAKAAYRMGCAALGYDHD